MDILEFGILMIRMLKTKIYTNNKTYHGCKLVVRISRDDDR